MCSPHIVSKTPPINVMTTNPILLSSLSLGLLCWSSSSSHYTIPFPHYTSDPKLKDVPTCNPCSGRAAGNFRLGQEMWTTADVSPFVAAFPRSECLVCRLPSSWRFASCVFARARLDAEYFERVMQEVEEG